MPPCGKLSRFLNISLLHIFFCLKNKIEKTLYWGYKSTFEWMKTLEKKEEEANLEVVIKHLN
jgi:hypothetical protein